MPPRLSPRRTAAAVLLAPTFLLAAVPDAGGSLEALRSAPALPRAQGPLLPAAPSDEPPSSSQDGIDSVRVTLVNVQFGGNTQLTDAALQALVAKRIGQALNLLELRQLAGQVTAHYRRAGFMLAWAYLPAQDLSQGQLKIEILEGRLADVRLDNRSSLSASAFAAKEALRSGEVLKQATLERSLLLLNDLAGVAVQGTLSPGQAVGSSDLSLQATALPAHSGTVELDNHGNRYTGVWRVAASVGWASPWQQGDRLTLRLMHSNQHLAYAQAAVTWPVGGDGWRVGGAASALNYALGAELAPLLARGTARVATLSASYPLLRSQQRNLSWQSSLDNKQLDDRIDSANTHSAKRVALLNNALVFDDADEAYSSSASASLSLGQLRLADALASAQDAASARSQGHFAKLNVAGLMLWRLDAKQQLYASWSMQSSSRNLDSSERMQLGGAWAVRAFAQGEAAGDEGAVLSLEWRHSVGPQMQLAALLDAGHVRLHHRPWDSATNQRTLTGAGLAMELTPASDTTVRASLAWPVHDSASTSGLPHKPRLSVQAVLRF